MLHSGSLQTIVECLGGSGASCRLALDNGWIWLSLLVLGILSVFAGWKLLTAMVTLRATALTPVLSRRMAKWVKSRS